MAKKKFYGVRKGKIPGVYSSWPQVQKQVKGFPGAEHKGFGTWKEADAYCRDKDPGQVKPVSRQDVTQVYTDGGAIGNPGPGGYGVVVDDQVSRQTELSGGFKRTTNNRMELMAVIVALEELDVLRQAVIHSDSKYVIDGITKGWAKNWQSNGWIKKDKKPALNPDLWEKLLNLIDKNPGVTFRWVKGHAGNPMNERADELANGMANSDPQEIDEGYQQG